MLTREEYLILNTCADDYELFYFPFAYVNYGGQISRRSDGSGFRRYEDDRQWEIKYSGQQISEIILKLIQQGYLDCWRIKQEDNEWIREPISEPYEDEFSIYTNYACITYMDHIDRFDYGPHEFKITASGVTEIHKTEYDQYYNDLPYH